MNGGLDKVSHIIKRQGLGLVISIVHFKSAGIEKFIIIQHKYININSQALNININSQALTF